MTSPASKVSRPRVLCIDDEPHVLAGLADLLRSRFDVVTVSSPRAGVATLTDSSGFAVVISDFRMPEMNGVEVLREARRVAPDTIRILLTGQASLENAIAAVNEGHIFRFLTKPCAPADLLRALEEALEWRQALVEDRAAMRDQLAEMSGQLRRADRLATLGTMASAVGHEINNLLMGMVGARSLIESDKARGRPPREYALTLMDEAQTQLTAHARTLLQLGRPARSEDRTADLAAAVQEIGETLRTTGVLRGPILQTRVANQPAIVSSTKSELQQILVNLIKNAVEAFADAPPSVSPRIVVSLNADAEAGTATMTVDDNAGGIPAERLPFVFEPYYTSKTPERGTGLGLFVVRQIIRDAGGDISVESDEGRGTTFRIVFPLASAGGGQECAYAESA